MRSPGASLTEPSPLRALVVGCGNIGAGYDLHDDRVVTFAKALRLRSDVELTVSDANEAKARVVAAFCDVAHLGPPSDDDLNGIDMVCICVPTPLHFDLIRRCVAVQVRLVICEKPLVATLDDVAALERMDVGATRIMVNYLRRFSPAYARLREQLAIWLDEQPLAGIEIRYVRGLLNYAGHALDLLEYVLDCPFEPGHFDVTQACFDAFPDDPTLVGSLEWDGVPVTFHGVANARYALFEIDLYTAMRRVEIRDRGNSIRCFEEDQGLLRERPELRHEDAIRDFMVPVIDHALTCLAGRAPDNFRQALRLNKTILTLIRDLEAQR